MRKQLWKYEQINWNLTPINLQSHHRPLWLLPSPQRDVGAQYQRAEAGVFERAAVVVLGKAVQQALHANAPAAN